MPNKNSGHSQGRQDQGGNSGAEQGAGLQERMSQVGDRVKEGYETARDTAARGYQQAEELVSSNPGSSVLIGFGVGFGVGVALTLLLMPDREPWYDRYVPDSLRNIPDRFRNLHMPEAIARHMPGH